MTLPNIMVAPNGAHKTKNDHPDLPITIAEVVATGLSCRAAGADGMHAHVRDENGKHVLDSGLYTELLRECERQMPGLYVQITTEAIGIYSPVQQDRLVRTVEPKAVSVALKEMVEEPNDGNLARDFYHWAKEAQIEVQHILYDARELVRLNALVQQGVVPAGDLQVLFVLGRYSDGQQSSVNDLRPFLDTKTALQQDLGPLDWAVCAFGSSETECLVKSVEAGGKIRVGFENNLLNSDGKIAKDNAQRVNAVKNSLKSLN